MATLPLTQGYVAIIDDADHEWLSQWKWHACVSRGVATARRSEWINGKKTAIPLSRFIMNAPKGIQVDHENRNTMDNQRHNLRFATNAQNCRNRKLRSDSRTGLKGVIKWRYGFSASIQTDGVRVNLGSFQTPELAYAAYCDAAKQLHGEFARLQ